MKRTLVNFYGLFNYLHDTYVAPLCNSSEQLFEKTFIHNGPLFLREYLSTNTVTVTKTSLQKIFRFANLIKLPAKPSFNHFFSSQFVNRFSLECFCIVV